jgi:hypothetical protein
MMITVIGAYVNGDDFQLHRDSLPSFFTADLALAGLRVFDQVDNSARPYGTRCRNDISLMHKKCMDNDERFIILVGAVPPFGLTARFANVLKGDFKAAFDLRGSINCPRCERSQVEGRAGNSTAAGIAEECVNEHVTFECPRMKGSHIHRPANAKILF